MRGFIRESNEPIEFNFKDDGSGRGGYISITLPDGESFEGKYRILGSSGYGVIGGDKGNTLKCSFFEEYPGNGFVAGGTGMCQVSDGRIIDIMWMGRRKNEKWDGKTIEVKGKHNIKVLENNRILFVPSGVIFKGTGTYHPRERDEDGYLMVGKGNYWEIQLLE